MKILKIRLQKFFKAYFYFSPSERKGISILLLLILIVVFIPSIYRLVKPNTFAPVNITKYAFNAASSQSHSQQINQITFTNLDTIININNASHDGLIALGFTEKNCQTIQNYLSKGGKIYNIDKLRKIYGIDSILINRIEPFLTFENETKKPFNYRDSISKKREALAPIELNSADSAQLVKLYRIGPKLAGKIIDYRNKLGGFLNLNQLTEIFGFDEDILYDLQGKIYIDAKKAKKINLNAVSEDELKIHPYFKYKLARVITNYRKQHGSYKNYADLLQIKIINDSILDRIKIYGILE
jgi:competence protein ComEA